MSVTGASICPEVPCRFVVHSDVGWDNVKTEQVTDIEDRFKRLEVRYSNSRNMNKYVKGKSKGETIVI